MNRFLLPRNEAIRFSVVLLVLTLGSIGSELSCSTAHAAESLRRSAVVRAVENATQSVVNIHGHKLVPSQDQYADGAKRVNGMGTGVVVDERGYVLTNFHVVEGVRRIQVTLYNGSRYIARLVAHDPVTDLAIIKIPVNFRMPVIRWGSSRDIMTGETVIALGNAYGYEHTVTLGIVSAQHRNVQVNDTQAYRDLIQTDASINPGNSGGPLMNIDGHMIGINVAVRQGAQGIGFAIPVDQAMQVAARLMSAERLSGVWHGVIHEDTFVDDTPAVLVKNVQRGSPAFRAGLRSGDVIQQVAGRSVERGLEFECAFIDTRVGEAVNCAVLREDQQVDLRLAVSPPPSKPKGRRSSAGSLTEKVWRRLGLELAVMDSEEHALLTDQFRGGLRVTKVDPDGVSAKEGIRTGDFLVGVHVWETVALNNVDYILNSADLTDLEGVAFYIVRAKKTYEGTFPVAALR